MQSVLVDPGFIKKIRKDAALKMKTQRPKDTEGVIRICKSKKDRQHKGLKIQYLLAFVLSVLL
jgi:hypothetical protein